MGEGIETEAELEFLRAQGCDLGQGFLFSRPLPAPQFEALLAEQSGVEPVRSGTAGARRPGKVPSGQRVAGRAATASRMGAGCTVAS